MPMYFEPYAIKAICIRQIAATVPAVSLNVMDASRCHTGYGSENINGKLAINDGHVLAKTIQDHARVYPGEV